MSFPLITKVNAYSGYKGDERPLSFTLDDQKIKVTETLEMWIEPDKDFFRVMAEDGRVYTISRERVSGKYYIESISDRKR